MTLKVLTVHDERITLDIADCPIYVSERVLALSGKKNSKLLWANTVVRCDEESGIAEGDLVYENDELLGRIVYAKGFKLQTLEGDVKNLPEIEHIKVRVGSKETINKVFECSERTPITFGYRKKEFSIRDFLCKTGNYIAIADDKFTGKKLVPQDLLISTGFTREDRSPICFGEFYQDGIVTLWKGLPVISKDGEYEQLCGK